MDILTPIKDIINSTRRIPYTDTEQYALIKYLDTALRNNLDIRLSVLAGDGKALAADGVILLSSNALHSDFLFIKVDAGRSIFGRQKANYYSYLGDNNLGKFSPGPSFRSFAIAITSINNIYRAMGMLKGPAM